MKWKLITEKQICTNKKTETGKFKD